MRGVSPTDAPGARRGDVGNRLDDVRARHFRMLAPPGRVDTYGERGQFHHVWLALRLARVREKFAQCRAHGASDRLVDATQRPVARRVARQQAPGVGMLVEET